MANSLNPFLANIPVSYPLKISKKPLDLGWGYKIGKLARKGLNHSILTKFKDQKTLENFLFHSL